MRLAFFVQFLTFLEPRFCFGSIVCKIFYASGMQRLLPLSHFTAWCFTGSYVWCGWRSHIFVMALASVPFYNRSLLLLLFHKQLSRVTECMILYDKYILLIILSMYAWNIGKFSRGLAESIRVNPAWQSTQFRENTIDTAIPRPRNSFAINWNEKQRRCNFCTRVSAKCRGVRRVFALSLSLSLSLSLKTRVQRC